MRVMEIRASRAEENGAGTESTCLALNPREACPIVDDQVVPDVLAERHGDLIASLAQRKHHGKRGSIADVFGMVHHGEPTELLGWTTKPEAGLEPTTSALQERRSTS
jgi:hypothetical protein